MGEVESGVVTPVETVVAEPTAPAQVQDSQEVTATPDAEQKPVVEKTFTQKELDEIVQKRLQKESRKLSREAQEKAQILAEREYYKRLAEEAKPAPQKAPDGKPVPTDFSSYDEYTEALAEWKVDQRLKNIQRETVEQQRQRQESEYVAQAAEKLLSGADKYPDFDEVVANPDLRVTKDMAAAIVETAAPVDVAYWLGENPKEAARIAALPPVKQVWEIGKIAQKFEKQATPTKAPPPITPNSGTSTTKDIWSEGTSWDEFVAARRKAMGKR